MVHITEHYSEQKWEGDDSEQSRVDLFIPWYTVCVDNELKWTSEIVKLEMSRPRFISLDSLDVNTIEVFSCLSQLVQILFQFFFFIFRAPEVSSEEISILLQFVQILVDEGLLHGE